MKTTLPAPTLPAIIQTSTHARDKILARAAKRAEKVVKARGQEFDLNPRCGSSV